MNEYDYRFFLDLAVRDPHQLSELILEGDLDSDSLIIACECMEFCEDKELVKKTKLSIYENNINYKQYPM